MRRQPKGTRRFAAGFSQLLDAAFGSRQNAVRQGSRVTFNPASSRSRGSLTARTPAGENRWLPAKPPKPWDGEYPALVYGANCPQRLHDFTAIEQSFLYDWTDGYMSEDMLKLNVWTPVADRQAAGDGLLSWRGFHLRLGLRAAVAGRRAVGPPSRRGLGHGESPAQPARISRCLRDRRLCIRGLGERRDDRPGRVAPLDPREHRELRRRSGRGHDLWPVGRRLEGDLPDGHALGGGTVPSRGGAVGRRRQYSRQASSPGNWRGSS